MSEEISNPSGGEMTDSDAVRSLLAPQEDKPKGEPETAAPEAEDATPAEDDASEAEEAPEETQPRYTVKVDGSEVEVELSELLSGYQRDADYRKKTQSVAAERRELEAARKQQEEITAKLLEAYQQAQGNETEPDWVKLAETDPFGWPEARAKWEAGQKERQAAAAKARELHDRRLTEVATREAELLRQKAPDWADKARFAKDYEAIQKDAHEFFGFEASDLASILDHRAMLVLRDAVEFRRLKAKGDPVRTPTPPRNVVKPGAPASKAEASAERRDQLRSDLIKRGDMKSAVRFILGT
jgi:hypothetical protein